MSLTSAPCGGAPVPLSDEPEFITMWAPDRYASKCATAIRYAPAVAVERTLGYLWASTTEQAAGFVVEESAGDAAFNAAVAWSERLLRSRTEGLTALEALAAWTDVAEEPRTGRIPPGSERTAASVNDLKRHEG